MRGVSQSCKIPETVVKEYVKAGNKNGFTAHYYLELHKMNSKILAIKHQIELKKTLTINGSVEIDSSINQ